MAPSVMLAAPIAAHVFLALRDDFVTLKSTSVMELIVVMGSALIRLDLSSATAVQATLDHLAA